MAATQRPDSAKTGKPKAAIAARLCCGHISLGTRLSDGQYALKMTISLVEGRPVLLIHPNMARAYVEPDEVLQLVAITTLAALLMTPSGREFKTCLLTPDHIAKLAEKFATVEVLRL